MKHLISAGLMALASQGAEVLAGTPEAFVAVMRNDIRKWAKVTAGLNLQMN